MSTVFVMIAEKLLTTILDFLKRSGEDLVKNSAVKEEINKAVERAAERFSIEYPDKELARALTIDTKFYDLPSIKTAIYKFLENPFNPAPQLLIEGEFDMVLPNYKKDVVFNAANQYLEILCEELIGVEKLSEKLKLIYLKRTAIAAERTADGIHELLTQQKVTQAEINNVKEKYLQYLIDTNTYIDPRGIMQTRRSVALRLDEIFVSLVAEKEMQSLVADRFDNYEKEYEGEQLDNVEEYIRDIENSVTVSLAQVIKENNRIVILGDPGAGKTTLMRFLSLNYSITIKEHRERVYDREGNDYGKVMFPVFVRIANFADAFSRNRSLTFRDYLLTSYDGGDVDRNIMWHVISSAISSGEAIVLLDGLDEIVDASDRAEIGRRLEQFVASCHSRTNVIITSRIAGYREAPLAREDFAVSTFTIRDMEFSQIEKFLKNWCPAVERSITPSAPESEIIRRAKTEIDEILESVTENPGVRRLASNPLMLTILALIHRSGSRLPSRRVELYELAVKTLLEDWELARGIGNQHIVTESEALRLLGPLAYWLHDAKSRGIASEVEIKKMLAETLATSRGLSVDDAKIDQAVNDFLRRVRQHAGLFVERAPRQYGFMHLTFEEYFAARELLRKRGESASRIFQHRHIPRWEEPILLAIAFLSNDYPDDAVEIIKSAILGLTSENTNKNFCQSPYEDVLHRDLLFAVQIIGGCTGLDIRFVKNLLEEILIICFNEGEDGNRSLRELIMRKMRSLRGAEACQLAVDISLPFTRHPNEHIRGTAAWVLGQLGVLSDEVERAFCDLLNDESLWVRIRSIDAIRYFEDNDLLISILVSLLDDTSIRVRNRCAKTLGFFAKTNIRARKGLISALRNEDRNVRLQTVNVLRKMQITGDDVVEELFSILENPDDREVEDSAFTSLLELSKTTKNVSVLIKIKSLPLNRDQLFEVVNVLLLLGYVEEDMFNFAIAVFEKMERQKYKYYSEEWVELARELTKTQDEACMGVRQKLDEKLSSYLALFENKSISNDDYSNELGVFQNYQLSIEDLESILDQFESKGIISKVEEVVFGVDWYVLRIRRPSLVPKASKYLYKVLFSPDINRMVDLDKFGGRPAPLYNYVWDALWDITTPI